jgi:hypothetical protein
VEGKEGAKGKKRVEDEMKRWRMERSERKEWRMK